MPAITGEYLYDKFTELGGEFAVNYISPGAQANMYFEKAIIELVEDLYLQIQDQRVKDELYGLVTTGYKIPIINPNSNSIYLAPISVLSIAYANIAGTAHYAVRTLLPNNLVTGQTIALSGATGLTGLVAGFAGSITVVSPTEFTFTQVVVESGVYNNNSATFYVYDTVTQEPLQLIDYFHLLNVTTTYVKPIYPPVGIPTLITNASNTPTVRISFFTYNNLRSGDIITLAGFSLNTNANGTFYINKVNDLQFDLYEDSKFQIPVAGNGLYVPTDPMTISYNYTRVAKPYMPDEKISQLSNPSEDSPRYLESDLMFKFYPLPPSVLLSVSLDYLRLPMDVYRANPQSLFREPYTYIDTSNGVLDLSTFYHPRFLQRLPEKVLDLVGRNSRDNDLLQENQQIQQNNP